MTPRAEPETLRRRAQRPGPAGRHDPRAGGVIVFYKHSIFARKSEAFADLLRSRGFRTKVRSWTFSTRALLKSSPDLWIGFWNHVPLEYLPKNYIS